MLVTGKNGNNLYIIQFTLLPVLVRKLWQNQYVFSRFLKTTKIMGYVFRPGLPFKSHAQDFFGI